MKNVRLAKCAIAVSAALVSFGAFAQTLPAPGTGTLDIWWKAPLSGATVSGTLSLDKCYINGNGVTKVDFYLDATLLNSDSVMTDGMSCVLDTTKFANGAHQLKAVARNASGQIYNELRSINIQNAAASNTAPTVAFTSPASGASVSATIAYFANATDNAGVARVDFFADSTAIGSSTVAPYSGNFDTRTLSDGAHVLRAVAYDAQGLNTTAQISINVKNGTTSTTTTSTLLTPPGTGALNIWWKAPLAAQTVSGTLSLDKCYIRGTGVTSVSFFLDATALNSDTVMSDGMSCVLDTTKFTNGTHTLKAVARDSAGAIYNEIVSINIQNTGSTTTTGNTAPTVSLMSPAAGATVSGAVAYSANATDNTGVAKVDFFVDSTALATKTAAPYSGSLDTTKLVDGTHVVKAVATDTQGMSATSQVSINVKNATSSSASLPSTGTKAIATFHSIGLYWTPGTNPGSAGCQVQFRKQGAGTWTPGLAMWYDARNSECRGSLVQLDPNTTYEVQMGLPSQAFSRGLTVNTWNESLPIAKTVTVPSGSSTLRITEGGSASTGYVLYTAASGGSTIDVANAQDNNVVISAPYVILRGFTLKGARINAVQVNAGTDVVIENNDISGWGRPSGTMSAAGYMIGTNMDSGIYARCSSTFTMERSIIQRNKIHEPRYGSMSWSEAHPSGPNAVFFSECGGNHVFRYNELYSTPGHYFMDAYGGEENFGLKGMPNSDSDLYGNKISQTWDDGIESEGANRNVRIWGNYLDNVSSGVATTVVSVGPIYIWRNVLNRTRFQELATADNDERGLMFKSGNGGGYGDGRRFVFHNTMLQMPPAAGSTVTLGGGDGLSGPSPHEPMTQTISRNNVFQVARSWWTSFNTQGGAGDDLDYDLYNAGISGITGAESHGKLGTPIYAPGNGPASDGGGMYQLAPSSPGYDKGARIPNFNDSFTGAAPDMGAHEAGSPAMKFGVNQ
jgi:hypothetical protein